MTVWWGGAHFFTAYEATWRACKVDSVGEGAREEGAGKWTRDSAGAQRAL